MKIELIVNATVCDEKSGEMYVLCRQRGKEGSKTVALPAANLNELADNAGLLVGINTAVKIIETDGYLRLKPEGFEILEVVEPKPRGVEVDAASAFGG